MQDNDFINGGSLREGPTNSCAKFDLHLLKRAAAASRLLVPLTSLVLFSARFVAYKESFALAIDERSAPYSFTTDPIAQQAYLKGSTGAHNVFGFSVAVSGDTAVVGASGDGG